MKHLCKRDNKRYRLSQIGKNNCVNCNFINGCNFNLTYNLNIKKDYSEIIFDNLIINEVKNGKKNI